MTYVYRHTLTVILVSIMWLAGVAGPGYAQDGGGGAVLPVGVEVATFVPGKTRIVTAESDVFFNLMIIPVFAWGSGTLSVSLSKLDTLGDFVVLMQKGYGYPNSGYNAAFTPRTVSLSSRFWDYGTAVVYALLVSFGDGNKTFRVSLSYN